MDFQKGLEKIVKIFEVEKIDYMVVGGFALSFYNRFRFTADIDCVIQVHPNDVERIIKYFPDWLDSLDFYKECAENGRLFNITDFDTGVKYDFMPYVDSDYSWSAFQNRKQIDFMGIQCFISSPEDLIISKLKWYELSKSSKQFEDLKFLKNLDGLNQEYLNKWIFQLNLKKYGLF